MTEIITREAGDSGKGLRLQRLRATRLLLSALAADPEACVACAIELDGDVHLTETGSAPDSYVEETKAHDPATTFSLLSPKVRNALVAFVDLYLRWGRSPSLRLGFYALPGIGRERTHPILTAAGLTPPDTPILESLSKRDHTDANIVSCVGAVARHEYKKQYAARGTAGYASEIDRWTPDDWIAFLCCVTWQLGADGADVIEREDLDLIRRSKYFETGMELKESLILGALLDLFDKRQDKDDPIKRLVVRSDVENIYLRARTGRLYVEDPHWSLWEDMAASDGRGLEKKLRAVAPSLSLTTLSRFQMKVAASLREQKAYEHDRSIRSLRYHVYDACSDHIAALLATAPPQALSESKLGPLIDDLVSAAMRCVAERARDHAYTVSNEPAIKGMVLELMDSCFLALDRGAHA